MLRGEPRGRWRRPSGIGSGGVRAIGVAKVTAANPPRGRMANRNLHNCRLLNHSNGVFEPKGSLLVSSFQNGHLTSIHIAPLCDKSG